MSCVKLLISSSDPQSFYLIEKTGFPHRDTTLEKIIPDFFINRELSAHIAVVCGGSERWNTEEFRKALADAHQESDVVSFGINKEQQPESTTITKTYSVLISPNEGSPEEQAGNSIEEVGKILRKIVDKLDTSSEDVEEDIISILGDMRSIGRSWKMQEFNTASTKSSAQSITELLNNLRRSNAIPPVMILIYLPEEAFTYFDETDHNFPKQIEYVLKVKNTDVLIQGLYVKIEDSEKKISELETERDAVIAERDAAIAKRDAAIAEKDAAIAEKDAAIAEKDAAIAEKDALIEKVKTESANLKGILALFQTLSSILLLEENTYAHEDIKHTFDKISTSQLEKIISFFNLLSEDRAKYDPHYSEFILSLNNPPKFNDTRNPFVATDELATRVPIDTKRPEAKKVPEVGDIEQKTDSTDESYAVYDDDRYKDRR